MSSSFYTSVEKYGTQILWRGYDAKGRPFSKKVKYEPTFYLPSKEETPYRALIGGGYLKPKRFDDMKEAREFVEKYKDVQGFDICGNTNYVAQFIQEKYPGKIEFDMNKINIFKFDIEVDISDGYADVDTADKQVTSIAAKSSKSSKYWLFGVKPFDAEEASKVLGDIPARDILYVRCKDEDELLLKFIELWIRDYPDVVTGWNVEYFDVQYIVTRIIRLFGEDMAKKLSPWGMIKKKTKELFGKVQGTYEMSGIAVIDYMDAFKKFGYKYGPQESYKLDHIAHVVLKEKKLDYSVYGSLTALYEQNPQLYLTYNLKDTHLIQRMEEESALLQLVLTVAYGGGVNYSEAFGTVGIWDTTIYRKLMDKNIVPFIKGSPGDSSLDLVGGHVKDPRVGMSPWVVSFDLNSLYPWLIVQYNMSPETYMPNQREYISADMVLDGRYKNETDHVVCANGACFRKDIKGIIPGIIEEYYANRSAIKKQMLAAEADIEEIKAEIDRRKKIMSDKTEYEEKTGLPTDYHKPDGSYVPPKPDSYDKKAK